MSKETDSLRARIRELENRVKIYETAELFWHCIDCGEEVGEDDAGYWFHKHRVDGPTSFDHEANPMPSIESIRNAFEAINYTERATALAKLK